MLLGLSDPRKFYQMVASVLGRVCDPLLIKDLAVAPPHNDHSWIAKETLMYWRQPSLDVSRLRLPCMINKGGASFRTCIR